MATIRVRENGTVELRVIHPSLSRPYYSSHESEEAANHYAAWLTAMLDRGQIPPELQSKPKVIPLPAMLGDYIKQAPIAASDVPMVEFLRSKLRGNVAEVTVLWSEKWVQDMKRIEHLSPGRIRKRVESLARAIDWYNKRTYDARNMPINPLRTLTKGYSAYKNGDAPVNKEARRDVERDRRLLPGEQERIEKAILGEKRNDRQRALEIEDKDSFLMLFRLIVDTGLRLREAYTLRVRDLKFHLRTVHVAKSKTGMPRDVPMKKHVYQILQDYPLPKSKDALVFPFWDGDGATLNKVSSRLSRQFARLFDYAGCEGLTEHDLRHEATCRWMELKDAQGRWLFRPEEVRKITGHKTERMFMRYYSLRGSDLAERLW